MNRISRWALAFALCVAGLAGSAHANTAADRLLLIAQAGKPISAAQIKSEAFSLLNDLGASAGFRDRFALMAEWDVTAAPKAPRLEAVDHRIIIAPGSVRIKQAFYAVVIAAGDVHIESGAGLLVVSAGNITFEQSPEREWAGVFVSKGSLSAPWLARAALHARSGAAVRSNSIDVLAHNTELRGGPTARLELRSGKPIFSGDRAPAGKPAVAPALQTDFQFAGERCDSGVPLGEIAERIPKMAREKTSCSDLDLVLVTCRQDTAGIKDEVWTVHACRNVLVDIRARRVGDTSQISFVPPPGPVTGVVVAVPPKLDPAQCPASDFTPACIAARIQQGKPAAPIAAIPPCPPPRPPGQSIDQLEPAHARSGFSLSALPLRQIASHFALARSLPVSRLEWSGLIQDGDVSEEFVIRIFRDADGQPGPLFHEATVIAQARSTGLPGYRAHHPFVFSSSIGPIELPAGDYWLSVTDRKSSGRDFMWGMERGSSFNHCGSGSTWRQGEKGAWVQIYEATPHRRARGYSFRLE